VQSPSLNFNYYIVQSPYFDSTSKLLHLKWIQNIKSYNKFIVKANKGNNEPKKCINMLHNEVVDKKMHML